MKKVIIISGPTATGKTSTSVELAKRINAEIVNFDSLYFYKELNIGTAKPSTDEMQGIKHHLIGFTTIITPINAADFVLKASPIINDIHSHDKPVILVGGSGFYLQALINGMYKSGTTPQEIITRSNNLYQTEGIAPFLEILKKHDPVSYTKLHENDHYRIRRAVEHFWHNKSAFSLSRKNFEDIEGPAQKYNWETLHFYLDCEKSKHWKMIEDRTDQMLDNGLIEEVKKLLELGYTGNEKPLLSIGYKQVQAYLKNQITSVEEMREKIIIATRQLAKAQRTWFAKKEKHTILMPNQKDILIQRAIDFILNQ